MTTGRIRAGVAAFAVTAIAATGLALAANQVKGATYSGLINRTSSVTFPISFKVSKNGKQVTNIKLAGGYPHYCQGGGFPVLGTAKAANISNKGTFTAKIPLLNFQTKKQTGYLVLVTGKFAKHGKDSGKVETELPGCLGTSPYTATG